MEAALSPCLAGFKCGLSCPMVLQEGPFRLSGSSKAHGQVRRTAVDFRTRVRYGVSVKWQRVLNVHSLQYPQCAQPGFAHCRGHGRGRYFDFPQPGVRTGRASREPNVAGVMAGGDPRSAGSSHTCEVPLAPCRDRFLQDKIMTVAGDCTTSMTRCPSRLCHLGGFWHAG